MAPFTIVKKAVEKLIRARVETDYLGSWVCGELEVFIKREYATAENNRGQTKAYVKSVLNDQDTRYKLITQFAFADLNGAIFDMPTPKTTRKANPAPRKRAAKKSTPKSFDQFTKRQLQEFITGCHNARDYGPEFTAACYALNSRTVAARKTNPATRKRAISRPSQVTKKAPTKRLVARRKAAAKKPVKGYFPNPAKKPAPHSALPYCVQLEYEGRGWKTIAAFAAQIPAENHAHGIAKKFPDGPSIRVIKK